MAVKFLMPHTHGAFFVTDDIASFEPEVEKDLVGRKIAETYKAPAKSAEPAK